MIFAVKEAERQRREAELAIENAKDLGNGVWRVDLPVPETHLTGVMSDFIPRSDVNVIIGVQNAGSGPLVTILFPGDEKGRKSFRTQLEGRKIRFIDGDRDYTDSTIAVYVAERDLVDVIDMLKMMFV